MVLCKVYRKATSLKELEQRAAMSSPNSGSTVESTSDQESMQKLMAVDDDGGVKEAKEEEVEKVEKEVVAKSTRLVNLPTLEVPTHSGLEWMQDPFLTQLRSPWMCPWSPYSANALNF